MASSAILTCIIFVPVLGALLLPLLGRISKATRNALSLLLVLCSLAGSLMLAPDAINGIVVSASLHLPMGMDVTLHADGLAVFMAIVSSLVSSIIVLYSFGYVSHYKNQDEYYTMVVLFLGAMMGLVFAGNLILLYVFWEITGIASWRLIGFFRTDRDVTRADKAFLVTAFGALAMLLGFILLGHSAGSFDMAAVKAYVGSQPLPSLAVALILMGILSKSATLPFHTWLPDAGVAPAPVTALLHAAVLVKIGVYVFARLFIVNFVLGPEWRTAVLIIAAASALVSAAAALVETDLKRIIAYSTISQIGFIFLGFAVANEMAVAGALLYILMHGIAKGGLFLCAGIVEQNTHNKDITKMGGLAKTMPYTAFAFLFCAFSVMGIPPFGGFFSKYMVIGGAMNGGDLWITLTFVVGAFMTIAYLLRVFNKVFLGSPVREPVAEGSPVMVGCAALLGVLSLVSGVLINTASPFACMAAQQMLGSR